MGITLAARKACRMYRGACFRAKELPKRTVLCEGRKWSLNEERGWLVPQDRFRAGIVGGNGEWRRGRLRTEGGAVVVEVAVVAM